MKQRWTTIAASPHQWERDALDFIRDGLPDTEPYTAWSNFEFVADDGSINEVDLMVLTPTGLFVIEIKSWPGTLSDASGTWRIEDAGKGRTIDNPLFLANRKAKRLASFLKRQPAARGIQRFPFVEALVFCSHPSLKSKLEGTAAYRVCLRDRGQPPRGILSALLKRDFAGAPASAPIHITRIDAKAVVKAVNQAGIHPPPQVNRVGDYELENVLFESAAGDYKDWSAKHVSVGSLRRIRVYMQDPRRPEHERAALFRAARREFTILESLEHRGILPVREFFETDRGPALTFRQPEDAVRLDFFMREHGGKLGIDARLDLLRQIAEALGYAHKKRIFHRALSPQSVLVSGTPGASARTLIFNWQTGVHEGTGSQAGRKTSPNWYLEHLIEDASTVYLAPESVADAESPSAHLDIFSLGAVAYFLFTGTPPASSPGELAEKIRDGKGLNLAGALDGCGDKLRELVKLATHPDVLLRWESVDEFLSELNAVEEELTRPDADVPVNPLDAKPGQKLPGGLTVKARIGSGATSAAFLVEKDGAEAVLKLADSPEHNDRLRFEFDALKKLRHPNVIEVHEFHEFGDLVGFTMQKAEKTLARRLRDDGKLNWDFLERFGSDLLEAVRFLEQYGIPHRDIKPDNIGVTPLGRSGMLHAVLFDFSLVGTSFDNLRAGTTPYLDPFLPLRKKWDSAAERFAAAMTLHEMAAGVLPKWGDGLSRPDLIDREATIPAEFFDPSIREPLTAFFQRALRRDAAERFDNADDMLAAWKKVFATAEQVQIGGAATATARRSDTTLDTPLALLGVEAPVANALDRINVLVVRDLLARSRRSLTRLRGAGNQTRRKIVELRDRLKSQFAEFAPQPTAESSVSSVTDDAAAVVTAIDDILRQMAEPPGRRKGPSLGDAYLGLSSPPDGPSWPNQVEAAELCGVTRGRVSQVVNALRERWRRNPSLQALRGGVAALLAENDGVMTLDEAAALLLTLRGSNSDEPRRTVEARAVLRAATEAESLDDAPTFHAFRAGDAVFLTTKPALEKYVKELGDVADRLVREDAPTPLSLAVEELRAVSVPDDLAVTSDSRLARLAAAASTRAALSPRFEFYPRGMAALTALKLARGAFLGASAATGPRTFTPDAVRETVAGRYPAALPLPDPPDLTKLLREAGLEFDWNEAEGRYESRPLAVSAGVSSSAMLVAPLPSVSGRGKFVEAAPEEVDARLFEAKLVRAHREGAFLALIVPFKYVLKAEAALLKRFRLVRRGVDELLIAEMRRQAALKNARWDVVLAADAAPREGRDWKNLQVLVGLAVPALERELAAPDDTVLAVNLGLAARYDRLDVFERLRERAGRTGSGVHGLWSLIAEGKESVFPNVNGKPFPALGSGQWSRVPEKWIDDVMGSRE